MGEKIIVGPVNRGLRNDRTPFIIDNDSFPTLINAYQWRGRIKRKRGTSLLNRLTRFFNSGLISYSSIITIPIDGSGNGNLITGFGLQTKASLVPGTIQIQDGAINYTDPGANGILISNPPGFNGTVNYASGAINLPSQPGTNASTVFQYYPDLPVMGLEELSLISTQFPGTLAFDTVYSYNIQTVFPYNIYDVSFYKNPATGTYPGYIQKTNATPTTWNGQDYQQFWTVNYQGSLWATNGINVPFNIANIGMQYKPIVTVTVTAGGPPAIANLQIIAHGLSVGDFLFINEVVTTKGINFQTGYVIAVIDANNVSVEFPNATIATNGTGGIAQYLTNRSDVTKDCLRWYDGDPTNGNAANPTLQPPNGWVNFAPPLNFLTALPNFSIADLPPGQYYLVGARMIIPFKDRLLFLGPVIQTSSLGSQVYLQDTIIYSQNGTPYYTASYTNTPNAAIDTPTSATNVFFPILVPINQTATSTAYFEDQTGFGGFISAGISQPIITSSSNEDVLIVGFSNTQTRLVYSGNDIVPFNFFLINSELGSGSTFSVINMDKGVMTRGQRGYIITSQVECRRIDLDIPDQVFQINLTNNGNERVCAQRDFINEWVYFTYTVNTDDPTISPFPNQTLQYNYRDDSWAIFNENYTTYGSFRKQTGFTWATVGTVYPTWSSWNAPWNAGSSTLEQPEVIAGNQQGFVLVRDDGTNEGNSIYIQNFASSLVTSPDHGLNNGDYIVISGVLGTIGSQVNGKIFSVSSPNANTFTLNPAITAGTYLGGGLIKRMYVPFIQTKQFPVSWGMARKTRIGVQKYLFSKTPNAQIQLLIFLSQDDSNAYNIGPVIPAIHTLNGSLIYSTVLFTCPESTNLGLTPANTNLQMLTSISSTGTSSNSQQQIWHRINTSLIGDTVQLGFTMSDEQMRDVGFNNQFEEIELHSFILDVTPSQVLA